VAGSWCLKIRKKEGIPMKFTKFICCMEDRRWKMEDGKKAPLSGGAGVGYQKRQKTNTFYLMYGTFKL
jgi:hypothetical protein